jgi:hypothetical protein
MTIYMNYCWSKRTTDLLDEELNKI